MSVFFIGFLLVLGAVFVPFPVQQIAPVPDAPRVAAVEFEPGDEPLMLIDYCRSTVATVGGDGYSEVVLWLYPDGSTQVHYYDWYEDYEGEERHMAYTVDPAVAEDAYVLIGEYGFDGWETRKDLLPGMTGARITLKYRAADGTYVGVSTDRAPEDGAEQMRNVMLCITGYVNDALPQGEETP